MNNFYQQYKGAIERFIDQALQEDIEGHDHSSLACFDAALQRKAELKVKEDCVIAGISLARGVADFHPYFFYFTHETMPLVFI